MLKKWNIFDPARACSFGVSGGQHFCKVAFTIYICCEKLRGSQIVVPLYAGRRRSIYIYIYIYVYCRNIMPMVTLSCSSSMYS